MLSRNDPSADPGAFSLPPPRSFALQERVFVTHVCFFERGRLPSGSPLEPSEIAEDFCVEISNFLGGKIVTH